MMFMQETSSNCIDNYRPLKEVCWWDQMTIIPQAYEILPELICFLCL